MIILIIIMGIVAGWMTNALSDRLPRSSGRVKSPADGPIPLALPAVVRLLKAARAGRGARRPPLLEELAIELGSAAFLAILWQVYGASQEFGLYCASFFYLLLIALIDLKHRLVLNMMIYPAILLVLAGHGITADQPLRHVLLGGGMAFAIFFLTAWLKPGQLGFGDVKLATLIGIGLGFPAILWALILGTGAAGMVTIWLLASRGASLKTQLPYAPFLCLGAMIALFYTPHFMLI
ncbi:MAG: prepilin peptidase [Chloroflexi bacterium]|nr:prepilin peptidase [Chloroflexota bacterium]